MGEVKWNARQIGKTRLDKETKLLLKKKIPNLPAILKDLKVTRALFVPEVKARLPKHTMGVHVVDGAGLLNCKRHRGDLMT